MQHLLIYHLLLNHIALYKNYPLLHLLAHFYHNKSFHLALCIYFYILFIYYNLLLLTILPKNIYTFLFYVLLFILNSKIFSFSPTSISYTLLFTTDIIVILLIMLLLDKYFKNKYLSDNIAFIQY